MTRYIKRVEQPQVSRLTIVHDDREKCPWSFLEDTYGAMEKTRLRCGDYSIKGFEDIVAIEKKSGIGELFADLTGTYRETFKRFLKRLSKYQVKCIVVESKLDASSIDSVLYGLKQRSNGRSKLTDETIYYWVSEIMCAYGIPVLFVDKGTMKKVLPYMFESAYRRAKDIKKEKV